MPMYKARCLKCGNEWNVRKLKAKTRRCTNADCRSIDTVLIEIPEPEAPSQPETLTLKRDTEDIIHPPEKETKIEISSSSLDAEGMRIFERELWLKARPIMLKVALNPKIFLFYDYAKSELKFEGDIGDFLVDCVLDFFNSRGIKIKIIKEKEVE